MDEADSHEGRTMYSSQKRLQAMEVRLGDSDRRVDFSALELTHVETSFVHREDCVNS